MSGPSRPPEPRETRLGTRDAAGRVRTDPRERFFGTYPGTVAVVTAAHDGDRNVLAVGWHAALSADPPLYGVAIAEARYTHRLGVAAGAFAVQFLPFARSEAIAGAGSLSRHDGSDKFARLGLVARPGPATGAPLLHDAYLAYECRLERRVPTGDHDWWVGAVEAIHHRPEAFDERLLKHADADPTAIYYGRARYQSLGDGAVEEFPPDRFRPPSGRSA